MFDPNQVNQILGLLTEKSEPVQTLLITAATFAQEDVTALGTGALYALGKIPLWPMLIGVFAGNFISNMIFWGLGRGLGTAVYRMRMLRKAVESGAMAKVEAQFRRSGFLAILLTRFIPGTRVYACAIAGVLKMPFPLFVVYSICAITPWMAVMLLIPDRLRWLHESGLLWWLLPVVVLAVAGIWFWKGRRRSCD